MKKKIRFIVNPISGVGKKNKVPKLIHALLDDNLFDIDIVYTAHRGHASELALEAVNQQYDIVCAVGGDGSVNEVGSALLHTSTALAILPAGSGNGVARHLKIPINLKKAILRINELQTIAMDTLRINGKPAIGVAGFGFDALIAKRFDDYSSRGLISYAKLVLKEWRKFKGINLTINDRAYSRILLCTIANTNQFGNNFYISPESDVTDGQFELVLLEKQSFFRLLNTLFKSLSKRIQTSNYVSITKHNKLTLNVDNLWGHIDGDPIEFDDSTIKIECLNRSLKVII